MEKKSKCCNAEIGNVGAYTNRCGECGKDCSTSPTTDEGKDCNCKTKYCSHFTSDFDNFCKDNPLVTPPESWEETYFDILRKCRDEFLSANGLGGISPINKISSFDPLLHFFSQTLSTEKAKMVKEIIGELESNPNEDGSESPNIVHWVEQKQIQLRRLFISPSEQEEKK